MTETCCAVLTGCSAEGQSKYMADPIPPKKPELEPDKPLKVDKPGTMQSDKKGVRFRPLRADKRGRPRKLKNDRRYVEFY